MASQDITTSATDTTGPATIRNRWTEKVSEAVARAIVQDIVARDLPPGTKLPAEGDMLEQYDVGRASLREALRVLEVHGLIHMKPGRGGGPVVGEASPANYGRMSTLYFQVARATFRELMDARFVIEPMMAGVAARQADEHVRGELRRAMGMTQAALDVADTAGYLDLTSEFHAVVLGVSGNRVLDLVGTSLRHLFVERVEQGLFPADRRHTIAHHHDEIAAAIIDGRDRDAEELMRAHMVEYRSALTERFPGLMDEFVDWR